MRQGERTYSSLAMHIRCTLHAVATDQYDEKMAGGAAEAKQKEKM